MIGLLAFAASTALAGWKGELSTMTIPQELAAFVDEGASPIDLKTGDLNGDARADHILILQRPPKDPEDETEEGQRSFLLILRQPDGSLKLRKRNDKIMLCPVCGGTAGDPMPDITLEKRGGFTVHHEGGSGERWVTDYTFGYSRKDRTWQLIKAHEATFQASNWDTAARKFCRPPRDFGKVDIADFHPETYLKTPR